MVYDSLLCDAFSQSVTQRSSFAPQSNCRNPHRAKARTVNVGNIIKQFSSLSLVSWFYAEDTNSQLDYVNCSGNPGRDCLVNAARPP